MSISFDELLQKAKEVALAAGKVAGDMVGEVVDTSKVKLAEARLCSEIREATERLGSIVYDAARTGRDSLKLQEMLITELNALYKQLDELRKRMAGPVMEQSCPTCEEKNPSGALFCIKCGARLIKEEPIEYAVDTEIDDSDIEEPADTAKPAEATEEPAAAEEPKAE